VNPDKLREVLIEIFGEGHEYKSGQFRVNCIAPGCDDSTANLEINVEQGIFHCWKCDYSGFVRQLFKDILGKDVDLDEEYISADALRKFQQEGLQWGEPVSAQGKEFGGLPKEFVPLWDKRSLSMAGEKALQYALTRMTLEDIVKYKVGYCGLGDYKWRVIVPIYEGGEIVYFVGRAIFRDMLPYRNSDSPKRDVIFNFERALKVGRGVLVEGVFDAIKIGEDPVVGMAALGTSLSEEQIYKLNQIPDLTIMFDQDAKLKTYKIRDKLVGLQRKPKVFILPHGDPDDFSRFSLQHMLTEAKAPDLEDFILDIVK
jgi:DNA primase